MKFLRRSKSSHRSSPRRSNKIVKKRRQLRMQTLESRRVMAGNPIISEFVASNGSSFEDGFGGDPDWIEIRNDADTVVDLNGYYLTDRASDLTKWQFTTPTILNPGEHLVVFASSLDTIDPSGFHHTNFSLSAGGEYLALSAPDQSLLSEFGIGGTDYPPQLTDVSYGVSGSVLVNRDSVAEYWIPTNDSLGLTWTGNSFDGPANGFSPGDGAAFGYEDSPGDTINYENLINRPVDTETTNLYARIQFDIPDASLINDLQLVLNYDDGVVAYLNGTQIISEQAPSPLGFNTPATSTHSDSSVIAGTPFDLVANTGLLVDGTNTLALHALNRFASSSDFLIIPELTTNSIAGDAGYLVVANPGGGQHWAAKLRPHHQRRHCVADHRRREFTAHDHGQHRRLHRSSGHDHAPIALSNHVRQRSNAGHGRQRHG